MWIPDQETEGSVGEEVMPQSFEVTTSVLTCTSSSLPSRPDALLKRLKRQNHFVQPSGREKSEGSGGGT